MLVERSPLPASVVVLKTVGRTRLGGLDWEDSIGRTRLGGLDCEDSIWMAGKCSGGLSAPFENVLAVDANGVHQADYDGVDRQGFGLGREPGA